MLKSAVFMTKSFHLASAWFHRLAMGCVLVIGCAGIASAQVPARASAEIKIPDSAFVREARLPAWAEEGGVVPKAASAAAVVVRLADTQVRVEGMSSSALVRRVLAVNNSSGLGAVGQYEIVFQPDYQRVKLHAVRLLRADAVEDRLASAKVRFVQSERNVDSAIFTGWVTAVVVVDDLRVGDSLDVVYSVQGDNPVFNGKYFDTISWDATVPVLLRRFTLDMPPGRSLNYRMQGAGADDRVRPEVSVVKGRRLYRFVEKDLPAVEVPLHTPEDISALRWLQLSEFSAWGQVVSWAKGLFAIAPLPAEFIPILAGLKAKDDEEARILKALSFVQNEIRYVSLSLGENSHRPFAPREVLARRYGDCKDKSLLLVSLLRETGIEAYPVLVSTQFRQNLETLLPSPHAFDHVIVKVVSRGKTYFLDPTLRNQFGTLAKLGQAHFSTKVLVVASDSERPVLLPPPDEALITVRRREQVTVDRMTEPAKMEVTLEYAGLGAEGYRTMQASVEADKLRAFYAGALDRRYQKVELVGDPQVDDNRRNNTVKVVLQYRIPGFIEANQGEWLARFQASNLIEQFYVPNGGRRTTPLRMPTYPFIGRYDLEISFPEEFDIRRKPYLRTVENDGFSLDSKLSMSGRKAMAQVEMRILSDRVAADRIPTFLEALRSTNGMLSGAFAVDKSDLKSGTQPALPFKQSVREQLENTIKSISEYLAKARGTSTDVAGAYCERALSHARLGRTADALSDLDAMVRQRPEAVPTLKCQATVQLITGNLQAGHQNFSRVIVLGQADYGVYFQRGLSAHYLKRFAEAAEDFARAAAQATSSSMRAEAEYWRLLSLRRGKLPAARSGQYANWPGPAIALLAGTENPEHLLQTLHAGAVGSDLDTLLVEGYLYIAQHFLTAGEGFKARAYLQQAVDKGALFSVMHHVAALEMKMADGELAKR